MHITKTILMEDNHPTHEGVRSKTLQQMQLFDLSQPKDITTFIEVDIETSDDQLGGKDASNKSTRPYPQSKKRKSINKNKHLKKAKITNPIQDESEENAGAKNTDNILYTLKNTNTTISQTVQDVNYQIAPNFSVSNYNENNSANINVLSNRLEEHSTQNTIQTNRAIVQPPASDKNVNHMNMPNTCTNTNPSWRVSTTAPNEHVLNQVKQYTNDPNHATRFIIENIVNYIAFESQQTTRKLERKLQLFLRCYDFIVQHFLQSNNDFNIFITKVFFYTCKNSICINYNQTRRLLDELLCWCRLRRSSIANFFPSPYNPPTYKSLYYTTPHHDASSTSLHTQRNLLQNNPNNKGMQISGNNQYVHAINKDQISSLSLGPPVEGLSIKLQNKPELELANFSDNVNIHEREMLIKPKESAFRELIAKDTENTDNTQLLKGKLQNLNKPKNLNQDSSLRSSKEFEVPVVNSHSLKIFAVELNKINNQSVHSNSTAHEVQNQTEIIRSSISRDSGFISPSNLNTMEDQPLSSAQQQANEEVTPIITHVTSLNRGVEYISRGVCSVCKQETNKQCIGCYKIYYCSRECQQSEWYIHKIICN